MYCISKINTYAAPLFTVPTGDLAVKAIQVGGAAIEQFQVMPHSHHRWGIFDCMTHEELLCFTQ
eukprot:COSAG06_NODE_31461_length_521_cov_0.947867_1_plen_63_part_10